MGPHRRRHGSGDLGWSRRLCTADARLAGGRSRPGHLCRPDLFVHGGGSGEHDGANRRHLAPEPRRRSRQRRRAVPAHLRRVRHRPGSAAAQQRLHRRHRRPNGDEPVADLPRQPGSGRPAGGDGTAAQHPRRTGKGRHRQGRGRVAGLHADCRRLARIRARPLQGSSSTPTSTPSGSSAASPSALGTSGLYSDVAGSTNGSTGSQSSGSKTADSSPTASSRAAALSLAAFGTVPANSWALPLLGVLVLTLLLPGLVLLVSGRSLSEALGGLRSQAQPVVADVPPVQEDLGEP